jgi:hypothetical protein
VVEFVHGKLRRVNQPRQDNLECIKLCLAAIEEAKRISDGVHSSPPGVYHRARWMAKGIYCFTTLLLRKQFHMPSKEIQAIHEDLPDHCHTLCEAMVHCAGTPITSVLTYASSRELKPFSLLIIRLEKRSLFVGFLTAHQRN